MKCRVCSAEFSDDRKSCPSCGRIITAAERKQYADTTVSKSNASVYRPAASKTTTKSDEAAFVQSLFSTDPNTPEYKDPNSYDTATADILAYDRTFVSKSHSKQKDNSAENRRTSTFASSVATDESPTIVPDYNNLKTDFDVEQHEDDYIEQSSINTAKTDRKIEKPHLNINPKAILIAILGIIGILIIVIGIYNIVNKLNISTPSNEGFSGQSVEGTKNNNDDELVETGYKTGYYTVTTTDDNIVVKNDEGRIIATIPNKTIIEITETDGDFGKTNYGGYKGWVNMTSLTFTPNEKPETTTEPESETENKDTETTTEPENTTAETTETTTESITTTTYTVTLPEGVDALNVRESANSDSTAIGIVRNGEKVVIDEITDGWGRIFIGEVEGWIKMEYVQ